MRLDEPLAARSRRAPAEARRLGSLLNLDEKLPEVSGDVAFREPERKHRPEQHSAPFEVAHRKDFDPAPNAGVGDARISQELPGLKRFDSMTVPLTAPGFDQSYLSRSHTRPKGRGHGFPSVTSAHVSPRSWTVRCST